MTTKKYDAVIVGAGPAGSALGLTLAKSGLSVLMIEAKEFPRDKPCGGLISGKCETFFKNIFGQQVFEDVCTASSSGCRMIYKNSLVAEVTDCKEMSFVKRHYMDMTLAQEAEKAGCNVISGTKAEDVDMESGAVRLASGRLINGSLIFGADGVNSVVRKSIPGKSRTSRNMGYGEATEITADHAAENGIDISAIKFPEIHFGVVPWGYGWIFPKGDMLSVGAGGVLDKRVNYRKALRNLIIGQLGKDILDRSKTRGHFIPYGNYDPKPEYKNVLLVGDAARFVDPITGEGLGYALESSILASRAGLKALESGSPQNAGKLYRRELKKELLPNLRYAKFGRRFLFSRKCLPMAMESLQDNPELVKSFFELMSGQITYKLYFKRLIAELFLRRKPAK